MTNSTNSLFTSLIEPSASVSPAPPPAPFDVGQAYLLGQCCNLSYTQLTRPLTLQDFAGLSLPAGWQGYTLVASDLQPFTDSELSTATHTAELATSYQTLPAGFAVTLTLTPAGAGQAQTFVVLTFRGTRTWAEWLSDAEAVPVPFAGNLAAADGGLGLVHGGFYDHYTLGTAGQRAAAGKELSPLPSERAPGSLAQQVAEYLANSTTAQAIYVTGHSLGGALATLAALDLAHNFATKFTKLAMYSLASPRVAMSAYFMVGSFKIPWLMLNLAALQMNYQNLVPNTYQIVNAADIVPILPPQSSTWGPLHLLCAQVTDPYQTSTVAATPNPPTSATELAAVTQSGSLADHVLTYCAQTGDIANNHSCANTYVPYLAQLAAGF